MSEERSDLINLKSSFNVIGKVRESLTRRVYWIGLALLIPFLGFSIIYLWQSGFQLLITLPILTLVVLVAGTTRLFKPMLRAWILGGILFGLGVFDLFLFGWMSDARLYLLASILIVSLLINKNAGYSFWGGGTVLTIGYLLINYSGSINPLQGNSVNIFSLRVLREWSVFAILGGCLASTAGFWLAKLVTAINETQANRKALLERRISIADQTQELHERIKKVEKHKSLLDATASVAGSLTTLQQLPDLLALTVESISEYFGFEHACIYLLDDSEKWAILKAASSHAGKNLLAQNFRLSVDETNIVGWAAANRNYITQDFEKDETGNESYAGLSALRTEIAIPLVISGDIVGVLDLQSANPSAFDDQTVDTLLRLVSELTLIFSAARRLESVPVLDIINPFYLAGQRIASAQSDTAIHTAILEILQKFNPSRLTFIRKEDDTDEFYTVFDSVSGQTSYTRHSVMALDNPFMEMLVEYAVNLNEPVWLEKEELHAIDLPVQLSAMLLDDQKIGNVGINPIVVKDHVIGVVVSLFDPLYKVNKVEKRLHRLVATIAALVIERNTLIAESAARTERETILSGVRQQLRSTLDPDVILRRTVQELGQLLGAERTQVRIAVKEERESSLD